MTAATRYDAELGGAYRPADLGLPEAPTEPLTVSIARAVLDAAEFILTAGLLSVGLVLLFGGPR